MIRHITETSHYIPSKGIHDTVSKKSSPAGYSSTLDLNSEIQDGFERWTPDASPRLGLNPGANKRKLSSFLASPWKQSILVTLKAMLLASVVGGTMLCNVTIHKSIPLSAGLGAFVLSSPIIAAFRQTKINQDS